MFRCVLFVLLLVSGQVSASILLVPLNPTHVGRYFANGGVSPGNFSYSNAVRTITSNGTTTPVEVGGPSPDLQIGFDSSINASARAVFRFEIPVLEGRHVSAVDFVFPRGDIGGTGFVGRINITDANQPTRHDGIVRAGEAGAPLWPLSQTYGPAFIDFAGSAYGQSADYHLVTGLLTISGTGAMVADVNNATGGAFYMGLGMSIADRFALDGVSLALTNFSLNVTYRTNGGGPTASQQRAAQAAAVAAQRAQRAQLQRQQ